MPSEAHQRCLLAAAMARRMLAVAIANNWPMYDRLRYANEARTWLKSAAAIRKTVVSQPLTR